MRKPSQKLKKISTQKPFVRSLNSNKKKEKKLRQLSFDDYLKKINQHTRG